MSMIGKIIEASPGIFNGDCETTKDILGPFYRPDAPMRNDMRIQGVKGNEIKLAGKVMGPDCKTPIQHAKVEVWHCDTEGRYDNDTDEYRHRGTTLTDKDGQYSFVTIIPGKYLNGRLYRPAHIHFRVSANGHKELISQIYFEGDPHITEDPWASQKKAVHRILPVFPETIDSSLAVKFDVYLSNL